ncbi:MAG: hypothetical protein M1834_003786 [Cirrosporium novae-zelandiae]|nr:MAG: hypothetical protein M1834_003786 [Cirrosporium novae-zelandiae]
MAKPTITMENHNSRSRARKVAVDTRPRFLASCYSVNTATTALTGFHYSSTGARGIPSPPASPPLAAYATKQELFNPNKSPEARRGGATYTITDECERLFCEKLRAVFLGERIQTNQDSLVMDTKYNKGYRKHDLAVRSAPFITEFIEVWDYIGGARFRGFTADGPRGRALFVFLDQGAIGSDLKSGLMALIELASSSHFDCTSLVACLDRKSEGNELKDLIRNFKWIGFELATLDRWTKVKNVTSSKWLFMEMEV